MAGGFFLIRYTPSDMMHKPARAFLAATRSAARLGPVPSTSWLSAVVAPSRVMSAADTLRLLRVVDMVVIQSFKEKPRIPVIAL